MAASAERRRQRGSEAAMAGSAVTASAARDSGGRDEDNGGDSDGRVHSRQSTKRGSGRDNSGVALHRIVAYVSRRVASRSRRVASWRCGVASRSLWRGVLALQPGIVSHQRIAEQ